PAGVRPVGPAAGPAGRGVVDPARGAPVPLGARPPARRLVAGVLAGALHPGAGRRRVRALGAAGRAGRRGALGRLLLADGRRRGWDRFVTEAGLRQVGPAHADPGNPGQRLLLYDLPGHLRDLYHQPARILVVHNASPDRDGTRRAFGLPVPADVPDALAAAAA